MRGEVQADPLLEPEEVERITSLSRRTIDRREAQGRFPRRVRLGYRTVRWVESEVRQWVADQMAARG